MANKSALLLKQNCWTNEIQTNGESKQLLMLLDTHDQITIDVWVGNGSFPSDARYPNFKCLNY